MGDEPGARAALRLGFLAVVRALAGRTAAIVTAEGNQVGPRGQLVCFYLPNMDS